MFLKQISTQLVKSYISYIYMADCTISQCSHMSPAYTTVYVNELIKCHFAIPGCATEAIICMKTKSLETHLHIIHYLYTVDNP